MHRRSIPTLSVVGSLILFAGCAGGSSVPAADSPAPAPTAQEAPAAPTADATRGFFTSTQAQAGMEVWGASCADCHDRSEMRGPDFMFEWEGSSVGRLFRSISRTMPDDNPGTLSTEQYLAVVAYILEMNELPEGPNPLVADEEILDALRIER